LDIVSIIFRYIHIVSAVLAVGGTSFIALCLSPAMRVMDDSFRETLLDLVNRRFAVILWASIAGLVVSGAYNWVMLNPKYNEVGPLAQALIGTKVLLAFLLFGLIWARHIGLIRLALKTHLLIAVHLGAIVILLGSILRNLHLSS
jgi:uncharacterized membrane protein